jgi:hypothetical protein
MLLTFHEEHADIIIKVKRSGAGHLLGVHPEQ